MADAKSTKSPQQSGHTPAGQALAGSESSSDLQRSNRGAASFGSPFDLMDRMTEEMDRVFDRMFRDFGVPRRYLGARSFAPSRSDGIWAPRIETFQKGDRFIVRAELPGLHKDDVHVELTEDALTIQGERRQEREEEREGYIHSEREYGQFYRTIPLPEGVISESAEAAFRDGVLEVSMQAAPSEANRGRRLEIKDAPQSGDRPPQK